VPGMFRVTHPFHPLAGRDLELVARRPTFGRDRVYYHDEAGRLRCLPLAWTSLAPVDAFIEVSAGRAMFRPADLLHVVQQIDAWGRGEATSETEAGDVSRK